MTERQQRMWAGMTFALVVALVAMLALCWSAGVLG